MSAQPSASKQKSLKDLLAVPISVPKYQREIAWKFDKMQKLWDDMFLHCQKEDPKSTENPYFIGALIRSSEADTNEVIDGQQRLTSLKVIASGIRDALISTGYHDKAWEIQRDLLYNYDDDSAKECPRFIPLHIYPTSKPELSNQTVLEPYHKIITPVFSGFKLRTNATTGSTVLDTDPAVTANWTVETEELHIYNGDGKKVSEVKLTVPIKFTQGHYIPITTCEPLVEELDADHEIWISPDTIWRVETDKQNKYELGVHEFHNRDFRQLYLSVRAESEHFILEEKEYRTVGNLHKDKAKTAKLRPLNEHHLHLVGNAPATVDIEDSVPTLGVFKFGDEKWYGNKPGDSIHPPLQIKGGFDPTPPNGVKKGATTVIKYSSTVEPNKAHNNDKDLRASTLWSLISDVWLIDVQFTGPNKTQPIDHFLNTNDRSKMAPLLTLDLLNALVHKITEDPYDPAPDPHQTKRGEIGDKWKLIWGRLYRDMDKNPAHAEDFFYQWMMASKRWNNSSRYKEDETFAGLQKIWEDSGDLYDADGYYNIPYLHGQFEEMAKYSYYYAQAIAPQNITGGTTQNEKHKQFLFILGTIGKQWLPPYLAMRYLKIKNATNTSNALDVINGFLKNFITLYLKYRYYPRLADKNSGTDIGAKFSPNDIYGKMLGESSGTSYRWISEIHRVFRRGVISGTDQTIVINLPKSVPSGTVAEWAVGNTNRKHVNGTNVKPFIMAFESIMVGSGSPTGWDTAEVEHVLPKTASRWPRKWWRAGKATLIHKRNLERLGNKALIEKQRNIHVKNFSFVGKKFPGTGHPHHAKDCSVTTCTNHYSHSNFQSISAVAPDGVRSYPTWNQADIISRTENMMDKIIQEFNF